MDNDLRGWKAFAAACHAFADTLEAELTAFSKNLPTRETAIHAEAEAAENAPTETESVASEETPVTADVAETVSEDEPTEAEITLPEIRAFLAEKSRAGFTDEVKELLKKHGSSKLSSIDPTEYAAIMKEAEELGS